MDVASRAFAKLRLETGQPTAVSFLNIMAAKFSRTFVHSRMMTGFLFCGLLGTGSLIAQDLRKLKKSGKKSRDRSNDRLRWDVGDLVKVKEGNCWSEAEIVDVHPKKMKEICEDDELVIELRSDHRTLTFPRNSDKIVAVVSKKDEDLMIADLVGVFEKYKDRETQTIDRQGFRHLCIEIGFSVNSIPTKEVFKAEDIETASWEQLRNPYFLKKFAKVKEDQRKKTKKAKSRLWKDLRRIIKICVPSLASKEAFALFVQFCLLTSRSLISVRISSLFGTMLNAVTERSMTGWTHTFFYFMFLGILGAFVNSSLKHLDNLITMYFRRRLTQHVHEKYLDHRSYYHISNMANTLDNPDQRITQDVLEFCKAFSNLYSHTFKPLLDFILNTAMLAANIGYKGPLTMQLYFVAAFAFVKSISPRFGKMVGQKQCLEGFFQTQHKRLLTHGEEIAFIEGDGREKEILNEEYENIYNFNVKRFLAHWKQGCIDQWVLKYQASLVGWPIASLPYILSPEPLTTQDVARYRVGEILMGDSSSAFGECLLMYKKVEKLAGYSSRVVALLDALEKQKQKENSFLKFEAKVDAIRVKNLTFEAPDRTPLLDDFSLDITQGRHLLITGKNGAGKSSLFRVLAGLWQPKKGSITRPPTYKDNDPLKGANMYYVPQKPYLVTGCLRDQVTYPICLKTTEHDERIRKCLERTGLSKFVRSSLDQRQHDWASVLSGGEKQRMGFARLFFHNPKFAVLDEATSAVEPKGQKMLYEATLEAGITMISIAHREELIQYHDQHIEFLGHGRFKLMKGFGSSPV